MSRLLLLAFLLASTAVNAQLLVKDDAGRNLIVRHHFKRIVTLAPFLTEAAFAAGAGDLVVGVDALSDYPREVGRLPRVPTGAGFSLEAIATLKPDLVLAWKDGIRMEDVEAITSYGATVYLAQARRLEDVPRLMQAVGSFTGRNVREPVAKFEGRLADIRRANAKKPRLTVFLEIWNRPLTTVGQSNMLSEAIEVCRGENVFADLGGMAPRVDWDEVEAANPYVVLGVNSANNAEEFHANWITHYGIRAVREGRMLYVESEALQRPSVRTLDSVARLCAELDKVRLHDALIAPSEAYTYGSGGPLAEAAAPAPAPEVLRRPMTTVERDVAAVLASTYALPKADETDAPPAADASSKPAPAQVQPAPPQSPAPPVRLAQSSGLGERSTAAAAGDGGPGSYTQVSRYGDLYFLSGQIALDPATGAFDEKADVAQQTRAALENVRRVLEGERLTMANVISVTVYLTNIGDLDAMDAAYEEAFRTRLPARTVVQATNLPRGARVEITVLAGR
jgi:iron complex transport system substrate-binding protein